MCHLQNLALNMQERYYELYIYLSTISSITRAANIVGTDIISQYLIKSKKLYLISWFLSIEVHIIPAKGPIGDSNAPIFDSIIAA